MRSKDVAVGGIREEVARTWKRGLQRDIEARESEGSRNNDILDASILLCSNHSVLTIHSSPRFLEREI